jgi:hypothetical protein
MPGGAGIARSTSPTKNLRTIWPCQGFWHDAYFSGMAFARSNSQETSNSPAVAALTEIVRLLARQAARELAEGTSETALSEQNSKYL